MDVAKRARACYLFLFDDDSKNQGEDGNHDLMDVAILKDKLVGLREDADSMTSVVDLEE